MSYGLRRRPRIEPDVDECATYIAQDNLEIALRFFDAIERTSNRIAEAPFRCRIWNDDAPGLADVRFSLVEGFPNYIIFFRVDGDLVELLRILHGARNLLEILGDDDDETNPPP